MFCCNPRLEKKELVEFLSRRIDNQTVKILDKNDLDQSIETMADAFLNDPLMDWLAGVDKSNPKRDELVLAMLRWLYPLIFRSILHQGRGVTLGVPDVDDEGSQSKFTGAMAVIPSGCKETTMLEAILFFIREGYIFHKEKDKYGKFSSKRMETLGVLTKKKKSILKPYPEHIYLLSVGVRRDSHGQGVGGKLFRALFDAADALQVPVYLETESKENEALYHHYGFDTIETPVLSVKGDTSEDAQLKMWLMLRRPR